jgi:hypothetical protein
MATTKARRLRVSSLGLLLTPLIFAAPKHGPAPILTVRVYNHAVIPRGNLEAAEREAQNIFGMAGVQLQWVECGLTPEQTEKIAACDRILGHSGPSLKLIPESMAAGLPRPSEQFALAIPTTIFVFCQRVRDAAEKSGILEARLLGGILAHELGHEVLGGSSHSPSGIMKAHLSGSDFSLAERGALRFTDKQSRQLRANLQR